MRRTEALQGLRWMKFEDVCGRRQPRFWRERSFCCTCYRQIGGPALPTLRCGAILLNEAMFRSRAVPTIHSPSAGPMTEGRPRQLTFDRLPAALLGVGLLFGVTLWARWGFAIAFDAIRTYCF
jgi:hypothetical protein